MVFGEYVDGGQFFGQHDWVFVVVVLYQCFDLQLVGGVGGAHECWYGGQLVGEVIGYCECGVAE